MPLGNPTKSGVSASGTYTGDNQANRAIPHGLGSIPSMVVIIEPVCGRQYHIQKTMTVIRYSYPAAGVVGLSDPVTTPDTTNFYVGNSTETTKSANAISSVYRWVAFP